MRRKDESIVRERGESQDPVFCGLTWTFLHPPQSKKPPPGPLWLIQGLWMVGGRPDRKETNNWSYGFDSPPSAPSCSSTPTPRDEERGGRGERFTLTERQRKLYNTEASSEIKRQGKKKGRTLKKEKKR